MFEIRLDDSLIGYYGELREGLIETLDLIQKSRDGNTYKIHYQYRNFDCEDLIGEIVKMTNEHLKIIVNTKLDDKISVIQHIAK